MICERPGNVGRAVQIALFRCTKIAPTDFLAFKNHRKIHASGAATPPKPRFGCVFRPRTSAKPLLLDLGGPKTMSNTEDFKLTPPQRPRAAFGRDRQTLVFYDTLGAFWGARGQPKRGPRAATSGPGAAKGAETTQERPGGFNNWRQLRVTNLSCFYVVLSTKGSKNDGLAEAFQGKV